MGPKNVTSLMKSTEITATAENQSEPNMREEIYRFEHGDVDQYRTTDKLPTLKSDQFADDIHFKLSAFWAEVFGYLGVISTFFITFFIQFYR